MPRVSVIIPTYNWSSVLPYSIGTALRQTFADQEVLVIGDGCTDDSESVVRAIAAGDSRVSWVNLPANTGHQAEPANDGIRRARGDVIAYLGHDDLWLPHHLALLVAAIDAGAGLAYGITALVLAGGDRVVPVPRGLPPYRRGMGVPPTSVVHTRRAVEAAGGWPRPGAVNAAPDTALWARMDEARVPFTFVPRLTAVKIPAALRRDVYRVRPCHEQAAWFARIGAEADFEGVELARMLVSLERAPLTTFLRRTLSGWKHRAQRSLAYKRHVLNRERRYKGLPPVN